MVAPGLGLYGGFEIERDQLKPVLGPIGTVPLSELRDESAVQRHFCPQVRWHPRRDLADGTRDAS